jgi:hypothetical protein
MHTSCAFSLHTDTLSNKGKAKARPEADNDDAGSVDSMEMDVDEPGSNFASDTGYSSLRKKTVPGKGKKMAPATVPKVSGSGRRKDAVSSGLPCASTYD